MQGVENNENRDQAGYLVAAASGSSTMSTCRGLLPELNSFRIPLYPGFSTVSESSTFVGACVIDVLYLPSLSVTSVEYELRPLITVSFTVAPEMGRPLVSRIWPSTRDPPSQPRKN